MFPFVCYINIVCNLCKDNVFRRPKKIYRHQIVSFTKAFQANSMPARHPHTQHCHFAISLPLFPPRSTPHVTIRPIHFPPTYYPPHFLIPSATSRHFLPRVPQPFSQAPQQLPPRLAACASLRKPSAPACGSRTNLHTYTILPAPPPRQIPKNKSPQIKNGCLLEEIEKNFIFASFTSERPSGHSSHGPAHILLQQSTQLRQPVHTSERPSAHHLHGPAHIPPQQPTQLRRRCARPGMPRWMQTYHSNNSIIFH